MQNTQRNLWNDIVRLAKEYWVEVSVFFVFVTVLFAIGLYVF